MMVAEADEARAVRRPIRSFQDLEAWQHSRRLVRAIYEATRRFPKEELYGLTNQIRRAAISVPSNIAEGYGRGSLTDYIRYLQTARGSLNELQTQLLLSQDLGYLQASAAERLLAEAQVCSRILQGLIASLKRTRGQ